MSGAINQPYRGPEVPLRFRYHTYEFGDRDIHLRTLRDKQQYLDRENHALDLGISSANWSLFGVVWDSSQVLAHVMADFGIAGKRILEVGCGMALTSHLLNQRNADITATDYHPEAGSFLQKNVTLNGGSDIPFVRTDWKDTEDALGEFDLIIGSDLLYETEHADLLAEFIELHALNKCEVIIVDPGRKRHARFSKRMVKLGFNHEQAAPLDDDYLDKPFKGLVLRYIR